MRMLEMDVGDARKLGEISREEALAFLKESLPIICQTTPRDFFEVTKVLELKDMINLEKQGIYSNLKFFIQ